MAEKDIQYKTSDILSLYGLSNKGLFYYEEKGLIHPQRASNGSYRVYSLQETARLHECRLLRSCGFSVEESIALVAHASPEELLSSFAQRKREIERDIQWSQCIMEQLEEDAKAIRRIEVGDLPWEVMERPPMLRIALRDVRTPYTQQSEESYQQWQEFLPIANASLLYLDGQAEGEELLVNLGFIMDADIPERLGAEPPKDAQLLASVPCLHTVISGPNDVLNKRERIAPVLSAMKARGLKPTGRPVTRMIASMDMGDGMKRYDHIWVPVE